MLPWHGRYANGRNIRFASSDQAYKAILWVVVVGTRLYCVSVVGGADAVENEKALAFLESFRALD
jgi:hypothetical protein